MGTLRPTAALVAAALIAAPLSSLAQPKPPTDSQKQQVSELVKKAIAKSQAGDHSAAIDLYQQAYIIVPVAVLLSNIATEYQAAGKQYEALDYFCKYLEADPTGNNVGYAIAKAKVIAMETRHTQDIDDKNVCKPPEPEKVPVQPPPNVDTTGNTAGAGSGSAGDVSGTKDLGHTATVTPSGSEGAGLRVSGYIVGGVGVAIAAVGAYYIFKSKQLNDDENGHDSSMMWPATIDGVKITDLKTTGETYNTRAYTFGIAGGAAVVAGGVLLYLGYGKKGSAAEHASIAPVVTSTSAGLALSGGF